jgi:dihydroorotate dehydrogenase
MIKKFYKLTEGKIPIVGCGGISSGKDALEFCKAGASLVQLYTALGYEGPGLIARMKQELADELQKENKTWAELVGTSS